MDAWKLLYSRQETAAILGGLGLRTVDKLVSEHKLEVRRVGKRVLIRADSLREYVSASRDGVETSVSYREDANMSGSTTKDFARSPLDGSNENK